MNKYETTLVFHAGVWYSEEDVHYLPDRLFANFDYFRFNHDSPEDEKPWLCTRGFTANIKTELVYD